MKTDVRAIAARGLAAVALRGTSLRDAMAHAAPRVADPRDRAFLSALLHEGARWWYRYDAALDTLVAAPLRRRDPAVHALLVLGLVQIEVLKLEDYAAVAATVEASRALGRGQLAGLVNAVLRRWLRERVARLAALDAIPQARHAHPAWLATAIARDWPAEAEAILAADNREPPLMLRVNRRHGTREALLARWEGAGITAAPHRWLEDALTLPQSTDVTRLPGFADGAFSVQDGAAQCAADIVQARDGMRVLDACAAPGGKACHLLERARVELTALESDRGRAERIRENLMRLRLDARIVVGDAAHPRPWWDGRPYERILVDAPCSATGVLRRRPDVRLHRREGDVATLAAQQERILAGLWPLLAEGGVLVYATCSLLRAENEARINALLRARPDARAVPVSLPAGQPAAPGWQILPGDDGLDGMYYAAVRRQQAAPVAQDAAAPAGA